MYPSKVNAGFYIYIYLYLYLYISISISIYIYICVYIYIYTLEHTSFLIRSCTIFGYVFIDSEYHKICFAYYFFTFYGQWITHFWFVFAWYISIFKIAFSKWTANNAVFDIILFNGSSFISVAFLVIQPSDGVTSVNTLTFTMESL